MVAAGAIISLIIACSVFGTLLIIHFVSILEGEKEKLDVFVVEVRAAMLLLLLKKLLFV